MRAFGLAASSYWDGRRFTNAPSFVHYYQGALSEDETLTEAELRTERLLFGLRTSGVEEADITDARTLADFVDSGHLYRAGGKVFTTSS